MYYPYSRGKQYELIAVRETAGLLAFSGFVPIIEPVKEQLSGLQKTLDSLCESNARTVVIVNPQIGEHRDNPADLVRLIDEHYADKESIALGILLTESMTAGEAIEICEDFWDRQVALLHAGFSDAKSLALGIEGLDNISTSVFFEEDCGKLYQKHFMHHESLVLLRDGFKRRRNRDHPPTEFFSDLHATFELEGMNGFGDFLIVGDEYSESGGPAYTVATHLTYVDADRDNEMHIRHFISDRQDTPQDPAGKFAEALGKLIGALDGPDNKFIETSAIKEFREFHQREHYPGLGYVKKLSMIHHLETLAAFFEDRGDGG